MRAPPPRSRACVTADIYPEKTLMKNPYVVLIPLLAALATPAPSLLAQPCPEDTLTAQSPLPLTDILTDYLPVDQISGGPVRKITICDREGWERKRPSILR